MLKTILRTAISLGFLGLLFYLMRGSLPEIFRLLRNINRPICLGATLLFLSTSLILAKRLEMIFRACQAPIKFREGLHLTFLGYFFNNFLPTSMGGDLVKILCASRITGQPVRAASAVLMDRIMGLFVFIVLPAFCFFFLKSDVPRVVPILIYSFLGFSLFGLFLLFERRIADRLPLPKKIRKLYHEMHSFKEQKSLLVETILLSLLGQGVVVVVTYLLALSLENKAEVSPLPFFILVPVVHLVSLFASLNGLGIREGAYIYFLSPYLGKEHSAALGVLWLALLMVVSLVGGLIYLTLPRYHLRSIRKKMSPDLQTVK